MTTPDPRDPFKIEHRAVVTSRREFVFWLFWAFISGLLVCDFVWRVVIRP